MSVYLYETTGHRVSIYTIFNRMLECQTVVFIIMLKTRGGGGISLHNVGYMQMDSPVQKSITIHDLQVKKESWLS